MKSYFLLAGGLMFALLPASAQRISGSVFAQSADTSKPAPLTGANIYWLGTTLATSTDSEGKFSIARSAQSQQLIASFVGYKNDTIRIGAERELQIVLQNEQSLNEVTVRQNASSIDRLSPHQTELITTRTLAKAACCNLSESFETNASVSVSYADAVTGAKQIQMLGLSGTYIQTNLENIPAIRGLASTFGLNFVPGTWIQSIDIGKGAGSVVNGYESMTGQINVELQKPDNTKKLYLNTYVNSFGRGEVNLNLTGNVGKKWSTGLLTHASTLRNRFDKNRDGFLDLPLYTQFNGLNRWKYQSDKFMAQFGVQALYEDRLGGQNHFLRSMQGSDQAYGFGARIGQYSFFSKMAKLFPDKPYKGLGLIVNASLYDSKSFFGLNNYDGQQTSVYANLIYQSIIGSTDHSFKTGLSYRLDRFRENYAVLVRNRNESVPGAFFEYTYNYLDRFVLVAGGRADFHNLYGTQWTPRLHLKYNLTDETTLRASAGRGFRVANPLAEYYGNLVSSRLVQFTEDIRPEVAWNMGASITHDYQLGDMMGSFIIDFYRTHFENQLIADFEDPRYIRFYNLHGRAFANSFQAEANLTPAKRFELKLAYRLFDVKQTQRNALDENALLSRAMLSRDRILFNAGYALPYDKWKFDATVQWNGRRRIPYMGEMTDHHAVNPVSTYSPPFYNIHAQVTRTFPKWDVYVGGENLTNFRQQNPIMGASDSFGSHFDAGMAWGPVTGRMIYAGMRYKIGG